MSQISGTATVNLLLIYHIIILLVMYLIVLPMILQDNQVLVVGSQDSFDFSVNKKNGDEGVYI